MYTQLSSSQKMKKNYTWKFFSFIFGVIDTVEQHPFAIHSAGDGRDPRGGDVVAKEFHLRHSENTLLLVDDQPSRLEPLEQGPQVPPMLGSGAAPDDNIIQVDKYEVQPGQESIHLPLEGVSGVAQAEGHPQELEKSERSGDGRLLNVAGMHQDLVVTFTQVYLTEEGDGDALREVQLVWKRCGGSGFIRNMTIRYNSHDGLISSIRACRHPSGAARAYIPLSILRLPYTSYLST